MVIRSSQHTLKYYTKTGSSGGKLARKYEKLQERKKRDKNSIRIIPIMGEKGKWRMGSEKSTERARNKDPPPGFQKTTSWYKVA